MGDIFKGSVNFGDLLNDIKSEVNKLKDAGEEAGEAIGVGFDDGFSETIQTIKASSIKLSGQFNNLRSSITKQVQQLSTIANGKKIKLKINFADIDMNSDKIKDRIRSILDDFSEIGAVEFDAKGSQQQFENLISLYVKYAEKLDKLQGQMNGFSASGTSPDKLIQNLQEQFVLAQEINKIVSFLQNQTNLSVPMYGQDFVIRNSKKYLDLLSKIKQETDDIQKATDTIKAEGEAAEQAARQKEKFVNANKEVANSGDATKAGIEAAVDAIEEEGEAAKQVASEIEDAATKAKISIDKLKADQNSIIDEYKKYGGKGKVSANLAEQFNSVLANAGVDASSITATFGLKSAKDEQGDQYYYDFIKLVAKGTDASKKATTVTREYAVATGELLNKVNQFKDSKDAFNLDMAKETAKSKLGELQTRMGSFKIDIEAVQQALEGINDETTFKAFLDRLGEAEQKLSEIKATLKSSKSLDPITNAENQMRTLETVVATYRKNIEQFANAQGFSDLGKFLDTISQKIKEFEKASEGLSKAKIVQEINQTIDKFNAQLNLVKTTYTQDTKQKSFALDKENQLSLLIKQQELWQKNGQLTDKLRTKIEEMFDSLVKVTSGPELAAWKKQWGIVKNEVMATKYEIEAANKAQAELDAQKAADKEAQDEALKADVVEQYDAIMAIINSKNNALKKLMSVKGPEEQAYWSKEYSAWFGAWNALDPDAISAFFADAGNQAMLGADKVNKFNVAVEESKVLSARQTDAQTKQDNDNLEHAIKLQNQLYDLKKKLAKVDAGSVRGQELTRQIEDKQEEYDASVKLLKVEEDRLSIQERQAKLEKEVVAAQKQSQNSFGKSIFNAEAKQYDKIEAQERAAVSLGVELSPDFTEKLKEYKDAFKEVQRLRDEFVNNLDATGNTALEKEFADAALKAEGLRKEVLATFKEIQKFKQLSGSGNLLGKQTFDPSDLENAKAAMIEYGAAVTGGQLKFEGFNDACTEMYGTLDQGNGVIQKVTIAMLQGTNTLYAYRDGTKQVSNSWQTLGNDLANGVKRLVRMYLGFHEAIQAVRKGLTYVKEIDLALTELKKVTDETDETYNKFLTTASEVSAVIGSTVSDFTDATAAFARLGYSINESSKMAETAIVYKNVADGLDTVEESTDSIISTMMAYGIAASDTMGIIDRFNAVGKIIAQVI